MLGLTGHQAREELGAEFLGLSNRCGWNRYAISGGRKRFLTAAHVGEVCTSWKVWLGALSACWFMLVSVSAMLIDCWARFACDRLLTAVYSSAVLIQL